MKVNLCFVVFTQSDILRDINTLYFSLTSYLLFPSSSLIHYHHLSYMLPTLLYLASALVLTLNLNSYVTSMPLLLVISLAILLSNCRDYE